MEEDIRKILIQLTDSLGWGEKIGDGTQSAKDDLKAFEHAKVRLVKLFQRSIESTNK